MPVNFDKGLLMSCGIGVLATIAAIPLGFVVRRKIRESNGALPVSLG